MANLLRSAWDQVLGDHNVAGYVYGDASIFHVYFETNCERIAQAGSRNALQTRDAKLLKGMPGALITQYQRHLRLRGVDIMSGTGGLLSSAHTPEDIAEATAAFEATVVALMEEGLAQTLR